MRLIDADALLNEICIDTCELHTKGNGLECGLCGIAQMIDSAPTVHPDEPKVMTLEEARNVEVVWAEDRSTREIYPCIVKGNMNDSKLYKYGVQWRCWTSRPTDEQRKAVKWDAVD